MTREELIYKVQRCTPAFGWEFEYPNLYGKYGTTRSGIYEGWYWFTEDNITDYARAHGCSPLTDATDIELLEMWAMADSAEFYFTEGNFGCDCNRSLAIRWEYGEDAIPELDCGDKIVMTEYYIEYWD